MTQRVFVNGRFLTQPLSGMQRYAEELVGALDAQLDADPTLATELSVTVLAPRGELLRRPPWRHVTVLQTGRLGGHAWEQLELGRAARDGVLLSLSGAGPLRHRRHVVALHDANVFVNPSHFSRAYGLLHRTLRPALARRAARLVTISRFSAAELSRHCGVPPDAFTLIHDSAEHIVRVAPAPDALARFGLDEQGYVLAVGNQSPNKNVALAAQALELSRCALPLVVAGSGARIFGSVASIEGERVRYLGRVSDSELRMLYTHAAVFVFPSRYEGFGVPPLEAMTLGCPVLSAETSAMPEILADAAAYFRGDDPVSLASALDRLLASPDVRTELVKKGRARAACYSWAKGARTLLGLVREIGP